MHLLLFMAMLISSLSLLRKLSENYFYLTVFKTGIDIFSPVFVVLFGIVEIFRWVIESPEGKVTNIDIDPKESNKY